MRAKLFHYSALVMCVLCVGAMHMVEHFLGTGAEVGFPGDILDRDAVKANLEVVKLAAATLGLRVGIACCTVHVTALYDLMKIPCPRHSACLCLRGCAVDIVDWDSVKVCAGLYVHFCIHSACVDEHLQAASMHVQGLTCETQGWQLKRLLSFTKNRLVNRPNRPRDPQLRELMTAIGVDWPSAKVDETDEDSSDDSEESGSEGDSEEDTPIPIGDDAAGDGAVETVTNDVEGQAPPLCMESVGTQMKGSEGGVVFMFCFCQASCTCIHSCRFCGLAYPKR